MHKQYNLGVLYNNGNDVDQDYAKAKCYYELAANQGDFDAQSNLGTLYERGLGVDRDYEMAVYYYELAADQGLAVAQKSLERLRPASSCVIS